MSLAKQPICILKELKNKSRIRNGRGAPSQLKLSFKQNSNTIQIRIKKQAPVSIYIKMGESPTSHFN